MDCGYYTSTCPLLWETEVSGLCVLLLVGLALVVLVLAFRWHRWRAHGWQVVRVLALTISLATLAALVTVSIAESFQTYSDLPPHGPQFFFERWLAATQQQVASLAPLVGVLVVATLLTLWFVVTQLRPTADERKA